MPHDPPRLVVDHPPPASIGVGEGGLHPRRGTRHRQDEGGVVAAAAQAGQVDGEHRRVRVEAHRGRGVEHPAQITVDQAAQGVGEVVGGVSDPPVLPERGVEAFGGAEGMGDIAEQRHIPRRVSLGDDQVEGDVETGVLHRQQVPLEDGTGQTSQQQEPSLAYLVAPVLLAHSGGPFGCVERVQLPREPGAKRDGPAAESLGEAGPLALGVRRDVDLVAVGDGAGGYRLRQRRLAHADHAAQNAVRVREALYSAGVVERERVVAEGAFGMEVAADEDALGAESGLREEGVGTAGDGGGHAVFGQAEPAAAGGGGARPPGHRVGGLKLEVDALLLVVLGGRLGAARLGAGLGELSSGGTLLGAGSLAGDEQGGGGGAVPGHDHGFRCGFSGGRGR